MKNLIEKLGKKFDEYHNEQLRIDNNQNPDYYLYMGKASAIGDLIDDLKSEMNLSEEEMWKREMGPTFKSWADSFFAINEIIARNNQESPKYVNHCFSKNMAFEDFMKATKLGKWTTNKFKRALNAYCLLNGFIFNPIDMLNCNNRIIQKIEGKTQEVIYIRTP